MMKIYKFSNKAFKKIFFSSYARGFITIYLLFMVIGASLLKLPISVQNGQYISWIDALFISASGLSTTGLSTVVVKDVFTRFGLTVLILIIQIGGIGLIMMVALFWLVVRKRIGFGERSMLMTDQNQLSREGIVRFVRSVLIVIFTIEILAFIVMSGYLVFMDYFPIKEALYQSFFTTISLFTNAGFDIAPTADSFAMYKQDYFMQSLAMILMFMGAVGFWPLYELKEFIYAKIHKERFSFSLFTKILVMMHVGIWMISALIFFGIEREAFLAGKNFFEGVYYTLFMTLTSRNAGFSTMDVNQLSSPTEILFMFLMFIGSSPNSAGGGIRTTTLLLVVLGIVAYAKGRDAIVIKYHSIKPETVQKSFIIMVTAGVLIGTSIFLLSIFETAPVSHLAFEIFSAFGTTGLSKGITSELALGSKIVIVIVMFIGRIGIVPLLLMFKPPKMTRGLITYPTIDIIVG